MSFAQLSSRSGDCRVSILVRACSHRRPSCRILPSRRRSLPLPSPILWTIPGNLPGWPCFMSTTGKRHQDGPRQHHLPRQPHNNEPRRPRPPQRQRWPLFKKGILVSGASLLVVASLYQLTTGPAATLPLDDNDDHHGRHHGSSNSYSQAVADALFRWTSCTPLNGRSFVHFTVVARDQVSPTSFILTLDPKDGRTWLARALARLLLPEEESLDRSSHGSGSSTTTATSSSSSSLFANIAWLRALHPHEHALRRAWRHGLWSLEVKQPQLQVARHYTPLPPLDLPSPSSSSLSPSFAFSSTASQSQPQPPLPPPPLPERSIAPTAPAASSHGRDGDPEQRLLERDIALGRLRILVRRVGGGEVSTWLSHRRVGDTLEIRGPHLGFDVRRRLGLGLGDCDEKGSSSFPTGSDVAVEVGRVGGEKRPAEEEEVGWPKPCPPPRAVVFLAGGTGIAPALQVARVLFDGGLNGAGQPLANGSHGSSSTSTSTSSCGDTNSCIVRPPSQPTLSIIWANRTTADCGMDCRDIRMALGEMCGGIAAAAAAAADEVPSPPTTTATTTATTHSNPIIAYLGRLQRRSGSDKLWFGCTVDEQGRFITRDVVASVAAAAVAVAATAKQGSEMRTTQGSWWKWWSPSMTTDASSPPALAAASSQPHRLSSSDLEGTRKLCPYHSASRLVYSGERDPYLADSRASSLPSSSPSYPSSPSAPSSPFSDDLSSCSCESADGEEKGKNLLMASGPEGFVAALAGPKVWRDGMETQGPVGGLAGELARRDPGFWGRWMVLKL